MNAVETAEFLNAILSGSRALADLIDLRYEFRVEGGVRYAGIVVAACAFPDSLEIEATGVLLRYNNKTSTYYTFDYHRETGVSPGQFPGVERLSELVDFRLFPSRK